jgi:class 3 adenylate cyclase
VDLQELTDAGLYDPDSVEAPQRLALLSFLDEQGCSLEEMVVAQQQDRLFALAGDRIIRPVVGLLSLREAGEKLGADTARVDRFWRTLGLPNQSMDQPQLTDADVDALRTCLDIGDFLGDDVALGTARVIGAAMARVTEAESAALRLALEGTMDLGVTHDELVTARAFAAAASLVPRIGQLLDAVHRQHLEATRGHFEDVAWDADDHASFRIGVGFADLSGFTRLSQEVPLAELSRILTAFEETATETVQVHGGRVVKFLGDAVMWVATSPHALAEIALALAQHPLAATAEIPVRAGVSFGPVLAQDGDYFGSTVNLASRLVALAEPGQVLAAADLAALLDDRWSAVPGAPALVRGFDEPLTPYALTPA